MLSLLESLRAAEILRLQLSEALFSLEATWEGQSQLQYDIDKDEFPITFSDPELQATNLRYQNLLKQLEHMLKRYRWTPTIRDLDFASFQQAYIWPRKEQWENLAVEYLLGRATQGGSSRSPSDILRLRQCRQCQTWFYAVTEHQTSCSDLCRKKFHAESEEAHSKRADYMRDYRRKQKELDRRAKKGMLQ